MKKTLLLASFAAFALMACDKDDSADCIDQSAEIKMNALVESVQVKAPIDNTFSTDFPIGVYGRQGTSWASGSTNLINNASATVAGAAGHAVTFDGPTYYYYPLDGTTVYLYAFAPRGTESTPAAAPSTSPIVDLSITGQEDVMYASGQGAKVVNGTQIHPALTFAHKLTQLQFTFVLGTNYPTGNKVMSLKVKSQPNTVHMTVGTGACTFTGSADMQALTGSNLTNGVSITTTPGTNANSPVMTQETNSPSGTYIFSLVVRPNGAPSDGSQDITYDNISLTLNSLAGNSHMITLTFNQASIVPTATVSAWVGGTGGSISI